MKKLFTTIFATMAMFGTLPIVAQSTDVEFNMYGHAVNKYEMNGIFSFTTNTSTEVKSVKELVATPNYGAVKVKDRYYVFNMDNSSGYGSDYKMYIYNATDYQLVTRNTLTADVVTEASPIAYDAKTDKVYSIFKDNEYLAKLCLLDLSKRSKTEICTFSMKNFLVMAFNEEGNLFGITDKGELYKLSTTGEYPQLIGNTKLSSTVLQGATFVPGDNVNMYWAATLSNGENGLYKVDVTKGTATKVKAFAENYEFAYIWAGDKIIKAGAPGKSTDLSLNFANGSLTGKVNFKAPSITHAGSALSGALTYTIYVDGVKSTNGSTTAGANVEAQVTTTQGIHDFTVVVSNTEGDGDKAELLKQYIGKDTPKAVSNVKLVRAANNTDFVLTWDNSTEGVHGGYVNPAEVKYKVVQMPAATEITKTATSPYTFTVNQDKPEKCFFDVTPYVDDNTVGMPMSSNKIMVGKPFTVPYTEEFNSNDNFLLYTTEHIGDGNAYWDWDYEYKWIKIYSSTAAKNDWIFTPFIATEKDMEYKLTFDVKTIGKEKFEVKYGYAPASASMTEQLIADTEVNNDNFVNKECKFVTKKNGIIYIGFHANTTNYEDAMNLYIDNIRLEAIGSANIDGIKTTITTNDAPLYNLAGQKVGKNYKGIVIQNGKKFMNR